MIKVCFFGMGSIGVRHLRNLRRLEKEMGLSFHITAFRSTARELAADVRCLLDQTVLEINHDELFDLVFITNPTSLHHETLRKYVKNGKAFFIEKPLFMHTKDKLEEIRWDPTVCYYVACPLRFHKVLRFLKEKIDPQKVYSVRSICSSYLPHWRPGIDYIDNYSAKRIMGGGVSLDLIHELDYLRFLFGRPERVFNLRKKVSSLEIDSEDISLYILDYKDKTGEVHLDYFGRLTRRGIEVFMEDEVIIGDLINNSVRFLKAQKEITFSDEEDFYLREMRYFLSKALAREKTFNEVEEAYDTLKLSEGGVGLHEHFSNDPGSGRI